MLWNGRLTQILEGDPISHHPLSFFTRSAHSTADVSINTIKKRKIRKKERIKAVICVYMVGKVPLLRGSMANAMTQFFTLFLLYSPLHCKYRKTNKKRHIEERAVQCPLLAKASGKVLLAAAGIIYIEKRRRRRVILLVPVYIKGMSE